MVNRPAQYTQADVKRAVKGAVSAGMVVVEVIASAEGVRLILENPNGNTKSGKLQADTWADVQ